MRGFMVLCLAAVAVAAPQYNYQQPSGSIAGAAHHAGGGEVHIGAQGSGVGHSLAVGGGLGGGSLGGGSLGGGSLGGGSLGGGSLAVQPQVQRVAPQVVYNKQIFIHSAPEEDAAQGAGSADEQSTLRKNLRVVIVRAPENKGLTDAALQLAKSASEDKTVVYVLNKQTDLGELQNKLSQLQESNPNKPEVHFVKYRTPEEAEHAQHSIQSQYDSFGGPTQVLDEGVAPVENFVGALGGGAGSLGAGSAQGGGLAAQGQNYGSVSNAYLPSVRLY